MICEFFFFFLLSNFFRLGISIARNFGMYENYPFVFAFCLQTFFISFFEKSYILSSNAWKRIEKLLESVARSLIAGIGNSLTAR